MGSGPRADRALRVRALALLATFGPFALFGGACTSDAFTIPSGAQLAVGTWGAANAGVIVSDSGTHVHVGCTFGDLPALIPLDEDGRFTMDGSYMLRAYPVAMGPTLPAQFSGVVRGRTLTLAVAVNDTVEHRVVSLGPVTVTYGRPAEMGPCPICRAGPRWLAPELRDTAPHDMSPH